MGLDTHIFCLSVNKMSGQNGLNEFRSLDKIRSCKIKIVSVAKNKAKRM